ncbi:hypothetical protein C8R44DRAFT_742784 [Mycena epipterygia]|nr:hypothetical protein C8R44DRAFT_742784 [Mycena epipterygia]
MLHSTLFVQVLVAAGARAAPSPDKRSQSRIARREEFIRQVAPPGGSLSPFPTSNWASAVITDPTVRVPLVAADPQFHSNSTQGGMEICSRATIKVGVDIEVKNGAVSYAAWDEYFPDQYSAETGFTSFSAGNNISLIATANNFNQQDAEIINLSAHAAFVRTFKLGPILCQSDAIWGFETWEVGEMRMPLSIEFTNAQATRVDVSTRLGPYRRMGPFGIEKISKSSTATLPKIPTQLPPKSAWAKGPPQNTTAPSPRSQSLAPSNALHLTHSRHPSTLGQDVPIKDGVPRNIGVKQGSIDNDSAPISSSPATPAIKSEGVKSFGSVPATIGHPIAASTSASTSALTSSTPPPSTPTKPLKIDVRMFFQGASSPAPPSQPENSSPSMRPSNLPQQQPQQQQKIRHNLRRSRLSLVHSQHRGRRQRQCLAATSPISIMPSSPTRAWITRCPRPHSPPSQCAVQHQCMGGGGGYIILAWSTG